MSSRPLADAIVHVAPRLTVDQVTTLRRLLNPTPSGEAAAIGHRPRPTAQLAPTGGARR